MDEIKRDPNKPKRPKTDHIRNIVQTYLHKRNYATIGFQENSKINQQITYTLVENEISRPNSILYSCYNSDPVVIDHNFTKFLAWVRDLVKNKNTGLDIELLVGPLFCHLYLDILKGGHPDKASIFLKAHLGVIDKSKCDDFVKDLINLFASEADATCMVEQFRGNKYFLELSRQTLHLLRGFVTDNCHVVFLHILQTWFDLQEFDEKENEIEEMDETQPEANGVCADDKFQKMLDVIHELENEPKQVLLLNIAYTNDTITSALIDRNQGILAFNQNNIVHLRPIHAYDSIMGIKNFQEIKLMDHSKRVYCIALHKTTLITASEDCTLCIYDLDEMKLKRVCSGHLGPVYCIKISSNNIYVASGSGDTTARLWNLASGQTLRIFVGHTQAITSIDFHPNCLYVATSSADRNTRLWSVDNGNPLRLFHGSKGVIYSIAFSPLGDILASVSDDKKIRFWDIMTCKMNQEFKYKGEPITELAWSDDGKQICTGSTDGFVRVWDVSNKQEPIINLEVSGKILTLEYAFGTFACVTS